MDMEQILFNLQKGLNTAKSIAGPLAALGVPGAGLAKSLLEIAENVQKRVQEGAIVATSDERARVKQIITDLQAENDRLNAEIEKS